MGALKIKVMSGTDACSKTVAKALEKAGFKPVQGSRRRHTKRVCRERPNQQWNIDFVKIGFDSAMGKKAYSLSVTDDHSR